MSDSSFENDFFGETEVLREETPAYTKSYEFQDFLVRESTKVDPVYGFIQLKTLKPNYYPG